MQLFVVGATSGLEKASWIVAIAGFGLIILQLLFYWFGRHFPLKVRAVGRVVPSSEGGDIVLLEVEFRSRSRDTQTIREIVLVEQARFRTRVRHPKAHKRRLPAVILNQPGDPPPLPMAINGHDTDEIKVSYEGDSLPSGKRIRLKVRASRKRPHVVRIRMR
jgi:hypothetical protein